MSDVGAVETVETIVQGCRQGDLRAFASLFARYQDRVYDLACVILRDETEAEDVVQDTFLRVFERIADYRGDSSFETWLIAVTVNVCRDRLRRQKVRRTFSLEQLAPRWLSRFLGFDDDPAATFERREQRRALWATLDHLDDRLRLPLILRYRYGLTCGEVAQVLGLAVGTVYGQLSEGRRCLRQMIQEQEERKLPATSETEQESHSMFPRPPAE